MPRVAVFLRAVNVGGTGKLPMQVLRDLCTQLGFENVQTYVASGNVALETDENIAEIKAKIEDALMAYAGKHVGVHVRTHDALCQIAAQNPFHEAQGNQVTAVLIDEDPKRALQKGVRGQVDEELAVGLGVLYAHYPNGMGTSKLKFLGALDGTARNMNTIEKMKALTEPASR